MQDFGTKADNSPPPGGQLSAAEFNNLATENENAVLRSGIPLSGASATQLAESMFLHGVKSESFQDSGTANAYVATPVSGAGGVLLPADYANLGGAVISFKASNANSGASTLNIGQTTGTLLGTKAIRTQADTALPSGAIIAGQRVQVVYNAAFDSGSGAWELLPWASNGGRLLATPQVFSAAGAATYTPTAGMVFCVIFASGGGGAGGGSVATAAAQASIGSGGASGSFWNGVLTAAQVGVSLSLTIGAGGSPSSGAGGSAGGSTSIGGLVSIPGGGGGLAGGAIATPATALNSAGIPGATPTVGAVITIAQAGGGTGGFGLVTPAGVISGYGAGSPVTGGAGGGRAVGAGNAGVSGTSNGSGGSGACAGASTAAQAGGAGGAGEVIIYEFGRSQ